ncbi:hypothetical protein HWV62_11996 [Athelia sp. TMB]|nr:hypothetical protein HWV62_11996 [Athelia sp. TMB]
MSADGQPPAKRRRSETPSGDLSSLVQPVRSEDVWYDDGNIILQAENTQFKVVKSILQRNSSVFKDMLSLPQPTSSDTELVEGCPVVHLSDSADEVRYVLKALFEREYVAFGEQLPLAVISAFICLGKKYDIQKLYAEAVKKMYQEIPVTLTDYDALPNEWTLVEDLEYMEVVILARRSGLLSLLPFVFYQCCYRYSTADIVTGLVIDDESKILLSHQDQIVCLGGYRACCEIQADTTYGWIHDCDSLGPSCTTRKICKKAKQAYSLEHFNSRPGLRALVEWSDCAPPDLCDECIKEGRLKHAAGRLEFWEKLPGIFDLPPWTQLLKERQEIN